MPPLAEERHQRHVGDPLALAQASERMVESYISGYRRRNSYPRMTGVDGYCSLMGQGRKPLPGVDAFGCLCSLRARWALDEVSWVQSGRLKSQSASGWPMQQNLRRRLLPPSASLLLGARFGFRSRGLPGLSAANSVPSRSSDHHHVVRRALFVDSAVRRAVSQPPLCLIYLHPPEERRRQSDNEREYRKERRIGLHRMLAG
jgi:hypothetical protein